MKKLRSQAWFGGQDKDGFIHRSWMKNNGLPDDAFDGRPIIGICNTFSDFTPCNAHFRELITHIKAGVLEAGGLPLEFPVFSCGESNLRPTAMLFRNLASMDVEEAIRANPMDGVVLMVGCDKTTPSLVMGAATCDLPTIAVSGGPMLNGRYKGKAIGSGTDVWKFSEAVRSGEMTPQAFANAESAMSRSPGHCMTMGTASTMACIAATLGFMPLAGASAPAVHADRLRIAEEAGAQAVRLIKNPIRPSQMMTQGNLDNATRVLLALGGSTNAVVHLAAIAGRAGLSLDLKRLDALSEETPVLVDLKPTGEGYMEDFHAAGGMRALLCMRLEKNFPTWFRELRPIYGGFEAGMDRFIDLGKNDFIGREAAMEEKRTGGKLRRVSFIVDAADADVLGDEPIWHKGKVVGWVTSGGFAHYVDKSMAQGYVPKDLAEDTAAGAFEIEIIGERRKATIITEPPFDPEGKRMRS